MSAKKTRENAGAAATEAPTKSYAKRDSAAADGAETAARKPRAAGEPTVSSVARELILEGPDRKIVIVII